MIGYNIYNRTVKRWSVAIYHDRGMQRQPGTGSAYTVMVVFVSYDRRLPCRAMTAVQW